MSNKQCPYRSQEHACVELCDNVDFASVCLQGQQVDALELISTAIGEKKADNLEEEFLKFCYDEKKMKEQKDHANAIMEKSADKLESSIRKSCTACKYYYGEWKECETCNENSKWEAIMERVMK